MEHFFTYQVPTTLKDTNVAGYKDKRDNQLMALLQEGKTYADVAKLSNTSVANMKAMVKRKDPDLYEQLKGKAGRPRGQSVDTIEKMRREAEQRRLRAAEVRAHRDEICDFFFADDDRTLEDAGDKFGITRERVRQIIAKDRPGLYEQRKQRKMGRKDVRKAEAAKKHAETHRCKVCDVGLTTDRWSYCSQEHYDMGVAFRYHIDPEQREKHKLAVARWMAENPTKVNKWQHESALRMLDPTYEVNERGRWFSQGSGNLEKAIIMYENGYKMFDLLPDQLQEQVKRVVEGRKALGVPYED